jgi:hypothetical protein
VKLTYIDLKEDYYSTIFLSDYDPYVARERKTKTFTESVLFDNPINMYNINCALYELVGLMHFLYEINQY